MWRVPKALLAPLGAMTDTRLHTASIATLYISTVSSAIVVLDSVLLSIGVTEEDGRIERVLQWEWLVAAVRYSMRTSCVAWLIRVFLGAVFHSYIRDGCMALGPGVCSVEAADDAIATDDQRTLVVVAFAIAVYAGTLAYHGRRLALNNVLFTALVVTECVLGGTSVSLAAHERLAVAASLSTVVTGYYWWCNFWQVSGWVPNVVNTLDVQSGREGRGGARWRLHADAVGDAGFDVGREGTLATVNHHIAFTASACVVLNSSVWVLYHNASGFAWPALMRGDIGDTWSAFVPGLLCGATYAIVAWRAHRPPGAVGAVTTDSYTAQSELEPLAHR